MNEVVCDCGLKEGHLYDCRVSEQARIDESVLAEREACALECEARANWYVEDSPSAQLARILAGYIRGRGTK